MTPEQRQAYLEQMMKGEHITDPPAPPDPRDARIAELEAALNQTTRYLETEREVSKLRAEANQRLSARIAELEALLREAREKDMRQWPGLKNRIDAALNTAWTGRPDNEPERVHRHLSAHGKKGDWSHAHQGGNVDHTHGDGETWHPDAALGEQ